MLEHRLQDRIAIVTGAASGIGEAIARRLAAEGAIVVVADVNGDRATTVSDSIAGLAVQLDVSEPRAVEDAFSKVEHEVGPIAILVNNAGITGVGQIARIRPEVDAQAAEIEASGRPKTPLDATTRLPDDEWAMMLAVNLSGVFYCTRAAIRTMQPRRAGAIVNIASTAGLEGSVGFPHYSAAKGGVLALTRSVAKEVAPFGIRVNAIAPGQVETPLWAGADAILRQRLRSIPLGRLGHVDDIAALAAFLASDDAAFLVGETISPNGGYLTV